MTDDIRQNTQVFSNMALELLFFDAKSALRFNAKTMEKLFLSYKPIKSISFFDDCNPSTREAAIEIDLGHAEPAHIFDLLEKVIQTTPNLTVLYLAYYAIHTGCVGGFKWNRAYPYEICYKFTVAETRSSPPSTASLISTSAHLLYELKPARIAKIKPTQDPNEVLIAP